MSDLNHAISNDEDESYPLTNKAVSLCTSTTTSTHESIPAYIPEFIPMSIPEYIPASIPKHIPVAVPLCILAITRKETENRVVTWANLQEVVN